MSSPSAKLGAAMFGLLPLIGLFAKQSEKPPKLHDATSGKQNSRSSESSSPEACPFPRNRQACLMSQADKNLSEVRAKAGAKGGKTVTAKKITHLKSIASQGGKTVTPKKRAHLASIAAKGGKTVTEKKREHLRKALAARWAKARNMPT
jgi:hypothetical protein